MFKVKFVDRKGVAIFRNYKWKEMHEIEQIAKKNKWLVASYNKEY